MIKTRIISNVDNNMQNIAAHHSPVCNITVASANDGRYSCLIKHASESHSIPRGAQPFFRGGGMYSIGSVGDGV